MLDIVGKSDGGLPNSSAGDGLIDMLRGLDKEDILEVLSQGVCEHCQSDLHARVLDLCNKKYNNLSISDKAAESSPVLRVADSNLDPSQLQNSKKSSGKIRLRGSMLTQESLYIMRRKGLHISLPAWSMNQKQSSSVRTGSDLSLSSALSQVSPSVDKGLSQEQEDWVGFAQVGRKKDFVHIEKINGKSTNVLQGLELHTNVFSADEQKKIVKCVYDLQRKGQNGQLRERTYTEPTKWMRGKGRVTIQFGCCYNYAVDKKRNPPGIIREEEVDPLPPVLKEMIKKMVRWHVLPPSCVPNSCIVNIYDTEDCIPPHIDHHDFVRPFCTVSFLTECNILFGSNLKVIGPGEFAGPVSIPLPVGSVLILNGNGADIAKHCVPGVPAKRISITFRKMDDSKLPYKFAPDPELQGLSPLVYTPSNDSPVQNKHEMETVGASNDSPVHNKQKMETAGPPHVPRTASTSSGSKSSKRQQYME